MRQGLCTELEKAVGAVDSNGHCDLAGRGDNTIHSGVVLAVGTSLTNQFCSLAWLGLLLTTTLGVEEERPPGTQSRKGLSNCCPEPFLRFPAALGWDGGCSWL